jgi:hypothetical protein
VGETYDRFSFIRFSLASGCGFKLGLMWRLLSDWSRQAAAFAMMVFNFL